MKREYWNMYLIAYKKYVLLYTGTFGHNAMHDDTIRKVDHNLKKI